MQDRQAPLWIERGEIGKGRAMRVPGRTRRETEPSIAQDPLRSFLAAVRRPLEFLAKASEEAAARTKFPAARMAEKGRALQAQLAGEPARLLDKLNGHLESFEREPAATRADLVRRCLVILDKLDDRGALLRAGPEGVRTAASGDILYRATPGDPSEAIARLGGSVQYVRGVGPRRAEILGKFGIRTVEDLLYHLPFRYEDRREVRKIGQLVVGEDASVIGELTYLEEKIVGRGRRHILEGAIRDETGLLGLTWYHQVSYFRNRHRIGQKVLVHGRVERDPGGSKRIVHPEIDPNPDEGGQGILPVYEKPAPITVGAMRKLVAQAVEEYAPLVPSVIPPEIAVSARIVDLPRALREIHLPPREAALAELNSFASLSHRSLVFDELFFLQLGMALRRRAIVREEGLAQPRSGSLTDRLLASLPFQLTRAQRRVLSEIYRDMEQPHPMHRLVQGDVGSGKTIVGLFAALVAIENGHQAAFMAPTELLAEQHFNTVHNHVEKLGLRVALLTGQLTRGERRQVYEGLAAGEIALAVGTHALIQEGVRFQRLGLGVIDEQHRFGVLQRAALRNLGPEGPEGPAPDILLMTATPIPRTLAMTVYGDLDVSVLDELPPGRKPVRTIVMNEAERQRVYAMVRDQLERGRQAYIVYPLVETSEREDLRDATTMAEELSRTVFPRYRVGLVHGRMKSEEKDAVMRRFRAGDIQVLVSTTVIEVGVDVPNATMMVVEHADRFGLSQLHQLRGRVGRGSDQATCVLVAPYRKGEDAYRRLSAMASTNDGFKIAEYDLELRGPGEFLGTRQSGLPDFRVANLIRDSRVLVEAREAAQRWLRADPDLRSSESAALRTVLRHRWADRLGLARIG